jgi:hypothetical protein
MEGPHVSDGGNGFQIWRAAANILNKQSRTSDKGWSSRLAGLEVELTTQLKNKFVTKCKGSRTRKDLLDK